jgi:tetratricopeptide (TPR) repeat protein
MSLPLLTSEPQIDTLQSDLLIVEVKPGTSRKEYLERQTKLLATSGDHIWNVSCSFDQAGPWAGVRDIFASLLDDIQRLRPDLIEHHAVELVYVLPRLRHTVTIRNPSLTDLASPEEKTRNYAADRAFRMVNGLIDLLDSWKTASGDNTGWLISCDSFDEAGTMSAAFFRELIRRRAQRLNIKLILGVSPGTAGSIGKTFGNLSVQTAILDLPIEEPTILGPKELFRLATMVENEIGESLIEKQARLFELIELWQGAGRPDKVLRYRHYALDFYNNLGLYADALRCGDESLLVLCSTHAPEDLRLRWAIVIKILYCYMGLQNTDAALRFAETQVQEIPDNDPLSLRPLFFYLLGMLYARYQHPRDYVKGEAFLERGIEELGRSKLSQSESHFQSVFNRNGLAMIRNFQGRHQEAIALCESGIERLTAHLSAREHLLHRSVLIYNIAQVYAATGAHAEALEHYAAVIALDPNYSEYYNERGSIYLRLGRLEEALEDYLKAINLSPPYFEVFINLGQCYRQMKRMEEAVDAYSRALDLHPNHFLAVLGRAQAHEELHQVDAAIADYSSAISLDPSQWEPVACRGVMYYEAGSLTEALKDFDRGIEMAPTNLDLYQNRATVLCDLGRHQDAVHALEMALSLDPPDADKAALQAQLTTTLQSIN